MPLREDPRAVALGWATRSWCASCLVRRGHLTEHQANELVSRATRKAREEREWKMQEPERVRRINARISEHEQAAELVDRAAADPVFRAALRRAAKAAALLPKS